MCLSRLNRSAQSRLLVGRDAVSWQTCSLRSLTLREACSEVNRDFSGFRKPTSSVAFLYHLHPILLLPHLRDLCYHHSAFVDTSFLKQFDNISKPDMALKQLPEGLGSPKVFLLWPLCLHISLWLYCLTV